MESLKHMRFIFNETKEIQRDLDFYFTKGDHDAVEVLCNPEYFEDIFKEIDQLGLPNLEGLISRIEMMRATLEELEDKA